MLLQYGVVAEVGPTTAAMVTYFIPVIATAAGVALLDESLTWNTPVGAVIVLAGAALTQTRGPVRGVGTRSAGADRVGTTDGAIPGASAPTTHPHRDPHPHPAPDPHPHPHDDHGTLTGTRHP
jgi:hypothetical protein